MEYDPAIKGTKKQLSAKEVEDLKKEYREEKKELIGENTDLQKKTLKN